MNKSEIFCYGLAVALCFGPTSKAEEAGSLTNVGELPLIKTADTCTKVFEIGEQHRRRGRIVSALNSYAWVVVNLPYAPLTGELSTKNAEAFISALASADRSDVLAFGDERAIRYLDRMISDTRLLLPLKKRAQDIKNTLPKTSDSKQTEARKEG
jgi:hypothetical protein